MRVQELAFPGPLLFVPSPHHDDRGLFTRTFDAAVAGEHGVRPESFVQDSQSRSALGVIRGMHGRTGQGEAKLVRVAHGAILDVLVDARPGSPTFGDQLAVQLDDVEFATLFVPPGLLHGFQALSEGTDVCYRIDRPHDPSQDLAVRFDDGDLDIRWSLPVTTVSARDAAAGTWKELVATLTDSVGLPAEA